MSRCVIVGGADIRDYPRAKGFLRSDDFVIYCDSGLRHMASLGAAPGLIVGDFDSHENPALPVETIVLPCEKDDTDTFFAVKAAVSRGFADFLLLGVIGGRLDHTLANVSVLLWLHRQGKTALAVDDYSEMEIVSRKPASISDRFRFFTLLPLAGRAEGVTVKNAKYPLDNAASGCDEPYGVSNEPLPGKTAEVSAEQGELLLIKDRE